MELFCVFANKISYLFRLQSLTLNVDGKKVFSSKVIEGRQLGENVTFYLFEIRT